MQAQPAQQPCRQPRCSARIPGMGQVQVFGGGSYAMRLWLDPQKISARNMTAGDVVAGLLNS